MKKAWIAVCLLFAFGCSVSALGADDAKKGKKDPPADGSTITITGMMAVKAKDAKADIVCRMTSGNQKMDPVYNLVATGELATKIQSMRENGDRVKVTGKVTGDNIEVASIERVVYMKK
ncbi:MAG TPA: hypothetical protein VKX17_05410 [Planctomycetota bacterium]|nr:hypothetical protein [Planctomycetota bacterium]